MLKRNTFLLFFFLLLGFACAGQKGLTVTAYYSGGPKQVDSIAAEKISHIIFSFCHLKGNRLNVDNARDTATLRALVGLKKKNPSLKVLLSLGGWGGCEPCSDVFLKKENRNAFARSVKELNEYFGSDGIDLDWEYPAIEGHPGHPYRPEDKASFTALVKELRSVLGNRYEVTFAAGGFQKFINESIDWKEVMPLVDRVYLMTYDLVNGYSKVTGHHTPLYSSLQQPESADAAINRLLALGVPAGKMVIGAAFYARVWEDVPPADNGLYQPGRFKEATAFKDMPAAYPEDKGFIRYWDSTISAPYMYHPVQKLFITYDDHHSIMLKTRYAKNRGLNGIMFWELTLDKGKDGLLQEIEKAARF